MDKVVAGWLALGMWSASVMAGLVFPGTSIAEETSFQKLDAEVEEVLNEVVSLGAEMAILEESREMTPSHQLLVLVLLQLRLPQTWCWFPLIPVPSSSWKPFS